MDGEGGRRGGVEAQGRGRMWRWRLAVLPSVEGLDGADGMAKKKRGLDRRGRRGGHTT